MPYFSEEIVDRIRNAIDIADIIQDNVSLKQKGKNYLGLCPFHSEKTPSFTVNSEKQIFYCFGCGTGGDVFSFLMKYENLNFPEAIQKLANRAGIELPEFNDHLSQEKKDGRSIIYAINQEAVKFFYKELTLSQEAMRYLQKRGIHKDLRRDFAIGYAPNSWDALLNYLLAKKFTLADIVKAGLAVQKDGQKKCYDRFRHRIMFPIQDIRGRFIGFGGRVIDQSEPKYLNSPETAVFQKKTNLFALKSALAEIKKTGRALVMEGYMDVISSNKYGVRNAVASLGTAFTREQALLLAKYAEEIVLVYDSDAAGINAALRSLDILENLENINVKVLHLANAKDPDEFLEKFGADEFQKSIDNASTAFAFRVENALKNRDLKVIEDKLKVFEILRPTLVKTINEIQLQEYIKLVSQKIDISEAAIYQELAKKKPNILRNSNAFADKNQIITYNSQEGFFKGNALTKNQVEYDLLKLVLQKSELVFLYEKEFKSEDFLDQDIPQVFDLIKKELLATGSFNLAKITEKLTEEQKDKVLKLSMQDIFEISDPVIEDSIKNMRIQILKNLEKNKRLEISKAEKEGNYTLVNELTVRLIHLQKQIQGLK